MTMKDNFYGVCNVCGGSLEPIWFIEEEYKVTSFGSKYRTGRTRRAVSHLTCSDCLKNFPVDDTFDGPWRD